MHNAVRCIGHQACEFDDGSGWRGQDRVVIVDLGLTHFADLESVFAAEEGTPSHLAPELVVAAHIQ